MKEHHLVLGGCGFIGRHVALLLAKHGHRVSIADRVPPAAAFPVEVADQITWVRCELSSADWGVLVADIDTVHHYAWTSIPASANANPSGDLIANVVSLIGLLDALVRRGGGRVVFSSSGGTVYGRLHQIPVAEHHTIGPINAYGAGKAAAEIYLNLYREMHGLDCRIARIANPYGAGQDLARGLGAVTTFLHNALSSRTIAMWGDGSIVRDYIHIADVAKALVKLATIPHVKNSIFNIGSGIGTSLNEIVSELERILNRRLIVTRSESRPFDIPISILSIEMAREQLNWWPSLSFRAGLSCTLSDIEKLAIFSTISDV